MTKEQILQEQQEAELLRNHGFVFETNRKSFLKKWFPKISWHVKPLCFGTITIANKYAVDLKLNVNDENIASLMAEMENNIDPLLNFISVSILHSKTKILLFRKVLTTYLKWHLNPEKALKIVIQIMQMYDLANFITSIRLIGTITSPKEKETTLVDGK